jgi:hypothetical protein
MSRTTFSIVFALLATCWQAAAHAEVWGYVDDRGVAHFAAEKVDERYALFFRGGESFDTSEGVQTPRPVQVPTSSTSKLLAYFDISPIYKQVKQNLREAAKEHGIEPELLQALIATESGFDPAAVSPKGAIGLMQIMPATAQRYGLSGDARMPLAKKLTDPRINIRTGVRYLSDLIRMFPGQIELALAAYNAGEGAVQRAGNRIPDYRETQNYVKTVMQLYTMLKPPRLSAPPGGPVPRRIRMELPGPAPAVARRNMPPGFAAATPTDTAALPDTADASRD